MRSPEVGDVLAHLIRDEDPERSVTVLAIDQFEEVWTAGADDGERAGFLDVIAELVSTEQTSVRVVLCLRADYLAALTEHPGLAEIVADNVLLVGPPTADETRRAIELPTARAGLRADIGLIDAIVTDAGVEPGLLPLLSTAMTRLWQVKEGNRLTFAAYLAGGSLTGAIAGLAEDAYTALSPDDQATARSVLMRLSGPGDGTAATRRRVRSAELAALPINNAAAVVDRLTAARLLTVTDGYVEVAHEALFQDWPRLRGWLAEDATSRDLQRRLAIAAAEWDADGREPFHLWRSTRLEAGLDHAHTHPTEITMTEKSFLEQSRQHVDAVRLEAEQKTADTIRQNRRLRGLLGVVVLVAVVALVAVVSRQRAVASEQQTQRVQAEAAAAAVTAEAGRLAAAAANNPQLDLALLTAVEAAKTAATATTYGALLGVLFRSPEVVTQFRQFNLAGPIAVAADGSMVYVATSSSVLAVDPVSGALRGNSATGNAVTSIATNSVDNRILVVKDGAGGEVSVLNPDDTTQWSQSAATLAQATGSGPGGTGMHALWLSDGTVLIAQDGRLVVVDGSTGAVSSVVPVPEAGAVDRLVQLPDGRISMAIASRAYVFDPLSRTVVPLDVPGIVAAAAGSGTLAVLSNQNLAAPTVTLFDAATLEPTGSGFAPTSFSGIAFSADGSTLANGNEKFVELRDGRTGELRKQLTGHTGSVVEVAFAPSGMLWSSGRDATTIGWDPDGNPGFFTTVSGTPTGDFGHNADSNEVGIVFASQSGIDVPFTLIDPRTGLALGGPLPQPACTSPDSDCWEVDGAITPDGTTAVGLRNQDGDAQVLVWNTADQSLRASFAVGFSGSAIDVTPDGKYAVVNSVSTAGVMDLSSGAVRLTDREHELDGRSGIEGEVAISPDGRTAAIGIKDGVRLLDLPSGAVRTESTVAEGARVAVMAWTPDSAYIMAGSATGYLYVLDAVDLHQVTERRQITEGRIGSIVISPTAPLAATMGGSGELMIWDTSSWQPVGDPIAPGARGWLGFDPNGATLRIMRSDGMASAMTADPASWLRTACQIANRDLTEAEWASIRPDQPLESTCAGLR